MKSDSVASCLLRFNPMNRAILVTLGAVMIHLSLGTYHTFGNMLPYIASYMRNFSELSVTNEKLIWIPTFQGCFPFAMAIGGALCSLTSPRLSASIGCALMTLGTFLSYWTIRKSLFLFLVTYGFMFGLGQGIAYVISMSVAVDWAPDHIGLISGIVSGGFGISAMIFAPIQTFFINPRNYNATSSGYFDAKELIDRVPPTFLILSAIYTFLQCIGLIVMCDPPDMESQRKSLREYVKKSQVFFLNFGSTTKANSERYMQYSYFRLMNLDETDSNHQFDDIPSFHPESDQSASVIDVLKNSTFLSLFFALFCCSFSNNMFYYLYKTFGQKFIPDDIFLALSFSFCAFLNSVARICWGFLIDRFSFQSCLAFASLFSSVLLFTMPITPKGGRWLYFLWMCLMFICMACTHASFITATVKCFGMERKTFIYGCLTFSTTLSAILLSCACEYWLRSFGYTWSFITSALFPLTAFFIMLNFGKNSQQIRPALISNCKRG